MLSRPGCASAGRTSSGSPSARLSTRFASWIRASFADPVAGTYCSLVVASTQSSVGAAGSYLQAARSRPPESESCSSGRRCVRSKSADRSHSQPSYYSAAAGGSLQGRSCLRPRRCGRNRKVRRRSRYLLVAATEVFVEALASSGRRFQVPSLTDRSGTPSVPNYAATWSLCHRPLVRYPEARDCSFWASPLQLRKCLQFSAAMLASEGN
jgi:hypothetical protein